MITDKELKIMSTDKKLKKLIIKSYPFLNNGESFEDDCEVIYEHYIGARESFIGTGEWEDEHEMMFAYILRESNQLKEVFRKFKQDSLVSDLSKKIIMEKIPNIAIDELLKTNH